MAVARRWRLLNFTDTVETSKSSLEAINIASDKKETRHTVTHTKHTTYAHIITCTIHLTNLLAKGYVDSFKVLFNTV